MKYLLDTNIISDVVRHPQGFAATRLKEIDPEALHTSVIVCSELRYGCRKVGAKRLEADYAAFLESLRIEDWCAPLDSLYADVRNEVERTGRSIGAMDLLIATQAIALDAVLVTGNERAFSYIPGLKTENWLK
jgi:tRNA(fMet)-specific endonuclease VapC